MDLESNPSNEVSHVRNEVIMFKSSTVLDYLSAKEKVKKFEPSEELIFFPEVGIMYSTILFSHFVLSKNLLVILYFRKYLDWTYGRKTI